MDEFRLPIRHRHSVRPYIHIVVLVISFLLIVTACKRGSHPSATPEINGAFRKVQSTDTSAIDHIVQSGELIVGTISGPDTYYLYQGTQAMGQQYALATQFASTLGIGVRVTLATDTLQLVQLLQQGHIDLIALPLTTATLTRNHLQGIRITDDAMWATTTHHQPLCNALHAWVVTGAPQTILAAQHTLRQRQLTHRVQCHARAPYISRTKGIISVYDTLFRQASAVAGLDWRLIAAQCYQESRFDPNAVSWAGAKGLMQLMPTTAASLNLPADRIFLPHDNVAAAARLLAQLRAHYAALPTTPLDRICFMLAAYNGGVGHIDDARALARKYGRDPNRWADVITYVRLLSTPAYYRDPIVRCGYMIGNETADYVTAILSRWQQYGGSPASIPSASRGLTPSASPTTQGNRPQHKTNRYSRQQRIRTEEEMKGE